MKTTYLILSGFILAQTAEHISNEAVERMQTHCYHLWTEQKPKQYQMCMDNEKALNTISEIFGFNVFDLSVK